MKWGFETSALENYFSSSSRRKLYTYMNNASTKYVCAGHLSTSSFVFVFHPNNGSIIEVKQINYDLSYSSPIINANGRISDDKIILAMKVSSTTRFFVTFINIDTWDLNSFYAEGSYDLEGFSSLFNTDQIYMIFDDSTNSIDFTIRATYDKLHYTELFSQMATTADDVTNNFTFTSISPTQTQGTDTASDLSITPTASGLGYDSSKSYNVTANIHSTSTPIYTSPMNTSSTFGPIPFDCYSTTTSASNANFTSNLSFKSSDGSAVPNWVYFNPSTPEILVTDNTAVSENTYSISNAYTGVFQNVTFVTNVTVNITSAVSSGIQNSTNSTTTESTENTCKKENEYCLGASSNFVCGAYIALIALAVIFTSAVVFIVLYYILKKMRTGRTRVNNQDDENASGYIENQYRPETEVQVIEGQNAEELQVNKVYVTQNTRPSSVARNTWIN